MNTWSQWQEMAMLQTKLIPDHGMLDFRGLTHTTGWLQDTYEFPWFMKNARH
jgi:hypothetical protein